MDKQFSIDRIEEGIAVLIAQNGASFPVLAQYLPSDAREGSVLTLQNGAWIVLHEETEVLRSELFELQDSLFDE